MSYVSSVLGGSSKIGDQVLFADVGTLYENFSGQTWLRSGAYVSPASAPLAATIPYLKATGQASSALPAALNTSNFDIATDGADRWVIAYGDPTNVMVSTNAGSTWSLVAHNAGAVVTSVCYSSALGLFISAGNSGSTFYTSSVAAASVGSTWTARTGSEIPTAAMNTARVRASSAEVVMVCGGGIASNASRSTNGTSWTAKTLNTSLSSSNAVNGLISLGGGVWITHASSVTGNRSTDGGDTWATVTYPIGPICGAFGSGKLVLSDSNGNFYTSTTGSTGSFTNLGYPLGSYTTGAVYGLALQHNGTKFVISAIRQGLYQNHYALSDDAITWEVYSTVGKSWADSISNASLIYVDSSGDYIMAPALSNHSGTIVYGNISTVTGVGIPRTQVPSSTASNAPVIYVRIV